MPKPIIPCSRIKEGNMDCDMKTLTYLLFLILGFNQVIAQENGNTTLQRKNVAILIFNGVQIIDFTGPYEVFGQAGYNVFTISEKQDTITTHMKLDVLPKYDFTNHPKVDIVVVPGGGAPHRLTKDNQTIKWINTISNNAEYILSVCNGAFFLASAGLLEDKEATTYAPMINHIAMFSPNTKPIYNKRFVQSGNIITAGGLSAGIDASLHVVSLDKGIGRTTEVANNMEYNWDPNSGYVRSKLADMQLLNVLDFNPPLFNRNVLQYEGDETYWLCEYEVVRKESLSEFYDQFDQAAVMYGWKKESESKTEKSIATKWTFVGFDNNSWVCDTTFMAKENNGGFKLRIELKLE